MKNITTILLTFIFFCSNVSYSQNNCLIKSMIKKNDKKLTFANQKAILKQIETGGPVGVTHKEMTRFFMTIPEAAHLILQSWIMGENNDLFVLDMGEPVKIYELAKMLIALEGYDPENDIKIKIIGLRPGEKLYEEVLVKEEETSSTAYKKIFRTQNYHNFDKLVFLNNLNELLDILSEEDLNIEHLKNRLKEMVSTYKPSPP